MFKRPVTKLRDAGFKVSLHATHAVARASPSFAQQRQAEMHEMHVRLGYPEGVRHRLMIDREVTRNKSWRQTALTAGRTCCDKPVTGYFAHLDESYTGPDPLCTDGCFSTAELRLAAKQTIDDAEKLREETERYDAERADHSRQLEADRETRRVDYHRRFPTEPTTPVAKIEEPPELPAPDGDDD